MVRNADELFELGGGNIAFSGDGSVLCIKPDLDLFEEILGAVRDRKIHSGQSIIYKTFIRTWLYKIDYDVVS